MDYPKLSTPLIAFIIAALCLAVVLRVRILPDWIRFFLALLAIILGVVGIMTLADWLGHNVSERLKEFNRARTLGAVLIANAIKDLRPGDSEAVLAMNRTYIEVIANDPTPTFMVRTLTRSIPFEFVEEFLQKSQEPFLYPVDKCGNKEYATALTNYIKSRGWATDAMGPYPAKLTKPLSWVAQRFGVELES